MSPFGKKIKKDRFLFEELSLRPEQLKEMKDKAFPFRADIDSRRYEIIKHRHELIRLLRSDEPDINKINAVISSISIKQEQMQRMITAHILEEKELLDKKQQHAFLDLIENTMTQGRFAGCPHAEIN
jgi:Spy/CpxP family protein refolding chaperone